MVNPRTGVVTIRVSKGGRCAVGPELLQGLHTLREGQRVEITLNGAGEPVSLRLIN